MAKRTKTAQQTKFQKAVKIAKKDTSSKKWSQKVKAALKKV